MRLFIPTPVSRRGIREVLRPHEMTPTPEYERSGGKAAFRWRALLRTGAWMLAALAIAVAVLVADDIATSGSSRSDPRKLRVAFAVLTGIPLACAAASLVEFFMGAPFARLEEQWRNCRRRNLLAWLALAAAFLLPLVLLAVYLWIET